MAGIFWEPLHTSESATALVLDAIDPTVIEKPQPVVASESPLASDALTFSRNNESLCRVDCVSDDLVLFTSPHLTSTAW